MKQLLFVFLFCFASEATAQALTAAEITSLKKEVAILLRQQRFRGMYYDARDKVDSLNYLIDSTGKTTILTKRDSLELKMDFYWGTSTGVVNDSPYVARNPKWKKSWR
jgi:hypothetical protein